MQSQKEAEIHTCIFLISSSSFLGMLRTNWPFQSYPGPLYQNDVKCSAFDKEMIFHSHANKNSFSQERLCTWPHFESEGFWNSKVAYSEFIDQLPAGLLAYLVRALHRHCRVQGLNLGKEEFFRLSFRNYISCILNSDDLLCIRLIND